MKVFVFEGEGGLTPGSAHETKNTAWGLGLDNLVFMVDWNDFGIDPRPASERGGGHAGGLVRALRLAGAPAPSTAWSGGRSPGRCWRRPAGPARTRPTMAWFVTQKGRGYGKVDAASHGTAWPMNAAQFWDVRKRFMDRYGVTYEGVDSAAPADPDAVQAQAAANLGIAMSVLRRDEDLVTWLSDRLLAIAATVPTSCRRVPARPARVFSDRRIFDVA